MALAVQVSNNANLSQADVDASRIRRMHREMAEPPPPLAAPDKPEGIKNLCPFGCPTEEIDEIGHCKHLVGFTSNGKTYEPQVHRMRPTREPDGKFVRDESGKIMKHWDGAWITDGKNPQLVDKTDILVSTGVSSRVYRKAGNPEFVPKEIVPS